MSKPELIQILPATKLASATIHLPGSKSIANRILIMRELTDAPIRISNLPDSDDVRLLNNILKNAADIEDCGAGGTTFRFLLALRAFQGKKVLLTGSEQLMQRPVVPLVKALRELGAVLRFTGVKGFPPISILAAEMKGGYISIDSDVSSQFISALMLIAPFLPGGLEIKLKGKPVSISYIMMTASLMKKFGAEVQMKGELITISEGNYNEQDFSIPPDWSAASYFYGMAACYPGCNLKLHNLTEDGLQGDAILVELMKSFGVETKFTTNGATIRSEGVSADYFTFDFSNCPDLAQTIAVVAAVKGIAASLTGLSTLRVKETDRLTALKIELEKTGVRVTITNSTIAITGKANPQKISAAIFETYNDHRMAMSLSILAASGATVSVANSGAVTKSFPDFWNQLTKLGIKVVS